MSVSEEQVRAAIKARIESVSGSGYVIANPPTAEMDDETVRYVMAQQSPRLPKGWLIVPQGFEQKDGDRNCTTLASFAYAIEAIYPYDRKRSSDGKSAFEIFCALVASVNAAFNANLDLGLGASVIHRRLQADKPQSKSWGDGSAEVRTIYQRFRLKVEVEN